VRLARLARGEPAEPPLAPGTPGTPGAPKAPGSPGTPGTPGTPGRAAATAASDAPGPDTAPKPLTASALALEQRLREAGLEPPLDAELDPDDLAALRAAGRAVRVGPTLHFHPEALAEGRRRVRLVAGRAGGAITLAALRDELGTSRKFAQALLEQLDRERMTIRRGDAHVLRTRGRGPL
jgi:hypothetical protein